MGNPSPDRRDLAEVAPEPARSACSTGATAAAKCRKADDAGRGRRPRCCRASSRLSLTDNAVPDLPRRHPLLSRRAEELTLITLGRLSASIAHEIRNPLAAISYSAQLLEESQSPARDRPAPAGDHPPQCQRMNGIVENILRPVAARALAPESLDLSQFVRQFVDEYRTNHPLETDELQPAGAGQPLVAGRPAATCTRC